LVRAAIRDARHEGPVELEAGATLGVQDYEVSGRVLLGLAPDRALYRL
jgi:hypothetical protein